eukprot:2687870-Rhodomonas_salina.1
MASSSAPKCWTVTTALSWPRAITVRRGRLETASYCCAGVWYYGVVVSCSGGGAYLVLYPNTLAVYLASHATLQGFRFLGQIVLRLGIRAFDFGLGV